MNEQPIANEPLDITDDQFQSQVLDSERPVLVDFWAPWCGPCRMVAPILKEIAEEYGGRLLVAKVNTDENNAWAGRYGIMGIPTMLFFQGGTLQGRIVGALPKRDLVAQLESFLSESEARAIV